MTVSTAGRLARALVLTVGAAVLAVGPGAPPAAAAGGGRPACAASAGDTTVDVAFRGTTYRVAAYVPASAARRDRPVVLNLHGSSGNGPSQMTLSGLRPVADAHGFVVLAPDGAIPLAPSPSPSPPDPAGSWAWNVPGVPTTAGAFPPPGARDDVAFLGRVLDVAADRLCTVSDGVHATGFSGGGRMVSALACRSADRIAAIAPVAGLRAGRPDPDDVGVPEIEDCRPARPVPVLTFHGQQDAVNPYPGSGDLRWGYSVPAAAQTWARLDGCARGPVPSTVAEHVTLLTYDRCADGSVVALYRVADGGHTWPGTDVPAGPLGPVTQEVDAAEVMATFFAEHR